MGLFFLKWAALLCVAYLLLVLVLSVLILLVKMVRSPRRYMQALAAHRRLAEAVAASNKGTMTKEQAKIVEDAYRLGMITATFWGENGRVRARHHVSNYAHEMAYEGEYPTV